MSAWPPQNNDALKNLESRPYGTPFPDIPELSAVRELNYTEARPMPPHVHPGQIEITYFERGNVSWWIGEDVLELTGGDICVTYPDEAHGSVTGSIEPVKLYGITLQLPEHGNNFLNLPANEGEALTNAVRALPRKFRATDSLAESFRRARQARLEVPNELNTASMRGNLIALLADIVTSSEQSQLSTQTSGKISRVLTLMQENLESPLTLEQIAELTGWSLPSLKARFRSETGTTPAHYYLRLRVLEGLRRLANEDKSITTVAHSMGFSSSQYFATCVRRLTGKTPKEFRP